MEAVTSHSNKEYDAERESPWQPLRAGVGVSHTFNHIMVNYDA